jgi:ribosomal protein S12 methylthiotransferase
VPLQHASDSVLRAMKRGVTASRQRALVEKLRARIPGVVLRTTFIVGFPGETDADFAALCDFVRETRFDRVGVFRYSDEEGTSALQLGGRVARSVSRARHRMLMKLQHGITADSRRARRRDRRCWSTPASAGFAVGAPGRRRLRSTAACCCAARRAQVPL